MHCAISRSGCEKPRSGSTSARICLLLPPTRRSRGRLSRRGWCVFHASCVPCVPRRFAPKSSVQVCCRMRIVIVGRGEVCFSLVQALAARHDIVVIEQARAEDLAALLRHAARRRRVAAPGVGHRRYAQRPDGLAEPAVGIAVDPAAAHADRRVLRAAIPDCYKTRNAITATSVGMSAAISSFSGEIPSPKKRASSA
jgi:hypothetical protein